MLPSCFLTSIVSWIDNTEALCSLAVSTTGTTAIVTFDGHIGTFDQSGDNAGYLDRTTTNSTRSRRPLHRGG